MLDKNSWLSMNLWPLSLAFGLLSGMSLTIVMTIIAIKTDRGVIETSPYERGLDYERTINEKRAFKESGIVVDIITKKPNQPFTILVKDRDGLSLTAFQVSGRAIRGASDVPDQNLSFTEVRAGEYISSALTRDGLWLLEIKLSRSNHNYIFKESLILSR